MRLRKVIDLIVSGWNRCGLSFIDTIHSIKTTKNQFCAAHRLALAVQNDLSGKIDDLLAIVHTGSRANATQRELFCTSEVFNSCPEVAHPSRDRPRHRRNRS